MGKEKDPVEQAKDEMEQFEREYTEAAEEHETEPVQATQEDQEQDKVESQEQTEETAEAPDHQSEEGADEPTAGGAEQEGEPPDEAATYAIPNDPQRWGELAGQKVTEEQFFKSGLINKLLLQEHQELHHMKKYQEDVPVLRQRLEEMERRLAGQQTPEQQPKPEKAELSPERVEQFGKQLEQTFLPQISKFAEMGGIEKDLTEDYPRFLSTLEYRFQSGQKLLDVLTQGFSALASDWMERNQANQTNEARTALENSMLAIANNEGFNSLSDESTREEFGSWLAENPVYAQRDVTAMGPDVTSIAFLEFMKQRGGAPTKATEKPAPRRREAMLATGGRKGSSGRGGGGAPASELEKFIEEFQQAKEDSYG